MGFFKIVGNILDSIIGPMPIDGSFVMNCHRSGHFGIYFRGRILTTDERYHIIVPTEREFCTLFDPYSRNICYKIAYSKAHPDRHWIVPKKYHEYVIKRIQETYVNYRDGIVSNDFTMSNLQLIRDVYWDNDYEDFNKLSAYSSYIIWKTRDLD